MADQGLVLRFDPLTIEHLGYKMYSHLPNALAELVANAYDADASHVWITLEDGPEGRAVVVEDDGHGMSFEDLNEKYLRIGRNRRLEGHSRSESGARRVAGKKGLGKLALFGIGETIQLTTRRSQEPEELHVSLKWSDIKQASGAVYHPELVRRSVDCGSHGTRVELRDLRRKTPVNPRELAHSMSRLFSYVDDNFAIQVSDGKGGTWAVTRRSRLEILDKDTEWIIPNDLPQDLLDLVPSPTINGRIVAAAKPVNAEHRGIALYAHGRLANEPEFFGISESSYAFSYLTGYLDVDYIDDGASDVISTDRRSVSWDSDLTAELREFLQRLLLWVSRERRTARRRANTEKLRRDHGVDVQDWVGTIRGPERSAVEKAASVLTSPDSVMADSDRESLLGSLREIAPDYADLHWRHLHPTIQAASNSYYAANFYHSALSEAMKKYVNDVRRAADLGNIEANAIMDQTFGSNLIIDVAGPYEEDSFDQRTLASMRTGQHRLSSGVVAAFRNPFAHEEEERLVSTEALTHKDCLDGLSIISHLYGRFEKANTRRSLARQENGTQDVPSE